MSFSRADARAGARGVAPMLLGVIPFGLVAGATPAVQGLPKWSAVGFSTIFFAGASQLAAIDVLGHGGAAVIAILAAWTINLRLVLYSASLAPYLADVPRRSRLAAAYLLVDQNYADAIARWSSDDTGLDGGRRLSYLVGGGLLLWTCWQLSTLAGVLVGGALPKDTPLDFALPLVFLVLLVPVLTSRSSVAAAVVGGASAVVAAELGAGGAAIVVGCTFGIAAGYATER